MALLYHIAPIEVIGSELYPLNIMKGLSFPLYQRYVTKYQGRTEVMERRIPFLDCLWNDVVFFSNVHPGLICQAYLAVGKAWQMRQWYAIDTVRAGFSATNAVIYLPDMKRERGDFRLDPEQFLPFSPNALPDIQELPEPTLAYYQDCVEKGLPILAWRGLPHVLYHGSVSLDDVTIIEI